MVRYAQEALASFYIIHTGEPPAEIADSPIQGFGHIGYRNTGGVEQMQPIIRCVVHVADLVILCGCPQVALNA
ncbi:hypothetical protein D3C75_1017510 [compost metagenome]